MKDNITSIHSSKRVRRARQAASHTSTSSLGWVWLLLGIVIGIISVILIHAGMNNPQAIDHLKTLALHRSPTAENAKAQVPKPNAEKTVVKAPESKKKYEFYTLLPGMEVQLPPSTIPRTPPLVSSPVLAKSAVAAVAPKVSIKPTIALKPVTPPVAIKAAPIESGPKIQSKLAAAQYIVQAGVFALPEDAKELVGRIGSKGFKPTLHKVKMRNGIIAYRVILGPYPTEVMALNHKKQLEQNKIHGILILKR